MPFFTLSREQFDALLRPLRPALLQDAARRVGRDFAPDMVQDAVCMAWHSISRYDASTGSQGLLVWLRRLVRDACRSHLSALRHEATLPPDEVFRLLEQGQLPDISSDYYLALRDTLIDLLARVKLTARQEICLRLWLDDMTQETIAKYLGITQQAVSQHVAAAAERLKYDLYWSTEVSPEVEGFFWRGVYEAAQSVYYAPAHVWDNAGTAQEVERRRVLFTARDEAKRLRRAR